MRRLYRYLPPFAGDYSGVCSVLYELGGMICIHDAAGCTGNYTGFDEPRSYNSRTLIYCTGLRKTDAILGNEEVYVQKIVRAAQEMKPNFIAIVGSPVPLVIGFDFNGVAKEIEQLTGIPTFGFATNGMRGNYKDGVVLALKRIMQYYGIPKLENRQEKQEVKVNILGATPLDISRENIRAMQKLLKENGYIINSILSMDNNLPQVAVWDEADVNLAVTQAGTLVAMEMEEKYGIPYLAGVPVGKEGSEQYLSCLHRVVQEQKSMAVSLEDEDRKQTDNGPYAIVIEDAVIAASIRTQLLAEGYAKVDIVSPFGADAATRLLGAETTANEKELLEVVNRYGCQFMAADIFLLQYRRNRSDISLLEIPKYAISSKLTYARRWNYIGMDWNQEKEKHYMKVEEKTKI